jgi:hypothetical protein
VQRERIFRLTTAIGALTGICLHTKRLSRPGSSHFNGFESWIISKNVVLHFILQTQALGITYWDRFGGVALAQVSDPETKDNWTGGLRRCKVTRAA